MNRFIRVVTAWAVGMVLMFPYSYAAQPTVRYQVDQAYPPYTYTTQAYLYGFDPDLTNIIFNSKDYELDYSTDTWNHVYPRLVSGEIDIAGIIAVTEERKQEVLFTEPLFTSYVALYTQEDFRKIGTDDLSTLRVGVGKGYYTESVLRNNLHIENYIPYEDITSAVQDLGQGKLDVIFENQQFMDNVLIKLGQKGNIIPQVSNLYPRDHAYAVSMKRPELVAYMNERIRQLKRNGVFEELYTKYFYAHSDGYLRQRTYTAIGATAALILLTAAAILLMQRYIRQLKRNLSTSYVQLQEANSELGETHEELMAQYEEIQTQYERIRDQNLRIQESEDRYRHISELTNDVLFEMNPIDRTLRFSDKLPDILGYSPDELERPEAWLAAVHPEDRAVWNGFSQGFENPGGWADAVEFRMLCKDGAERWIQLAAKRDPQDEGLQGKIIGAFTDVTERRGREATIEGLNHQLEEANLHLTRANVDLSDMNALLEEEIQEHLRIEAELEDARRQAERANRAKTNFLSNMSHEIRTPLNGILGMTSLVQMTDINAEQQEYLSLIRRAGTSLLRIINDILDYSKIEAEKLVLEESSYNIRALLHEVVALFDISARQKDLKVTLAVSEDIPYQITGDPVRLRQIVSNLVGNAVKFTDHGTVQISVKPTVTAEGQQGLHFSISDTGIGIPEEQQLMLFERFTQLDSSFRKKYQGTGLGLAISKKLVELMGGSIWVESRPGEGSTFHFTILLAHEEASVPEPVQESPEMPTVDDRKEYIAIVAEDEEINQTVIRRFVERMGVHCILAENGRQAVEIFEQIPVDIILMDVQMPVMDGVEATERIRSLEKKLGTHTPIIALTAYALSDNREGLMSSGMDDYLSKPLDLGSLKDRLHHWLRRD